MYMYDGGSLLIPIRVAWPGSRVGVYIAAPGCIAIAMSYIHSGCRWLQCPGKQKYPWYILTHDKY